MEERPRPVPPAPKKKRPVPAAPVKEAPPKKLRVATTISRPTCAPDRLSALPPALSGAIIDFLAGDDYYHPNGRHYWSRQMSPLPKLARVSRHWYELAEEPKSARLLTTLRVRYKQRSPDAAVTRSEMLEMRHTLILYRAHLKRMILEDLPDYGAIGEGVWRAALSHAPKLRSLDMDTGDLARPPSQFVLDVTRAAANQCPMLRSLMFPSLMSPPKRQDESQPRPRNYMHAFADGVFECLPAWSKHGGLRHLRMTMRERIFGRQRVRSYLKTITTHCPKLEILDGFASTVESVGLVTCEERWNVDLDVWKRFCDTCDQLTMFDWVPAPFATEFFEAFGATPKLKLTNLTFSMSVLWNWRRYLATVNAATRAALDTTGFACYAKNAHAVFKATPNLKECRVEWFDMPGRPGTRSIGRKLVDPEIFGDDFCMALAENCKGLTKLQHGPVPTNRPDWSPNSIVSLTDASLRALAKLPELSWVEIVGANITGDGLFDLVINHAATTRHERVYYFVLGDTNQDGVTSMVFYDVLKDFLERLLAYEGDLPCASRPVMVQLDNAHKAVLDQSWSAAYFNSLLLTVEKLQKKYPTIQLSGLVRDYNEEYGVVKRVAEFAFATESAHLPEWSEDGKDVEAVDDEIDGGVFTNRQYYGRDLDYPGLPGSRRDDDAPESEDDEGSDEDEEEDEEDDEDDEDDDHNADHDDAEDDGFGVVDGEEIVFDNEEEPSDDDDDFSDEEEAEYYDAFIDVDGEDIW